jgi:hypothetical protein
VILVKQAHALSIVERKARAASRPSSKAASVAPVGLIFMADVTETPAERTGPSSAD